MNSASMSYQDAVAYLDSLVNYEKKGRYRYKESLKLGRVLDFLNIIGRPQSGLKCVHVAGTKGKGSVCAFTAYLLRRHGYKVGLYTSPHLSDPRERIRILNPVSFGEPCFGGDFEGIIPENVFAGLVDRIKPRVEAFCSRSPSGPLSFFEVYTAMALEYFRSNSVDFAVIETGLGGRLDATNVVTPCAAAITSVSYDHTDKLGSTLREIAGEKAGIVKSLDGGVPLKVISAPQPADAAEVIRDMCGQKGAQLFEVGKDILYETEDLSIQSQTVSIKGVCGDFPGVRINLPGVHQASNAAVAAGLSWAAVSSLSGVLSPRAVIKGFGEAKWPGRFEFFPGERNVILDGAHNEDSARALAMTLRGHVPAGKVVLVSGASKDKDLKGIFGHLAPLARLCIATRSGNPRAFPADVVARCVSDLCPGTAVLEIPSVNDAMECAKASARADEFIVVTGSLFIVGEARDYLSRQFRERGV